MPSLRRARSDESSRPQRNTSDAPSFLAGPRGPRRDCVERLGQLLSVDFGEIAQAAEVDPEHGDAERRRGAQRAEQGPVAAEREDEVAVLRQLAVVAARDAAGKPLVVEGPQADAGRRRPLLDARDRLADVATGMEDEAHPPRRSGLAGRRSGAHSRPLQHTGATLVVHAGAGTRARARAVRTTRGSV